MRLLYVFMRFMLNGSVHLKVFVFLHTFYLFFVAIATRRIWKAKIFMMMQMDANNDTQVASVVQIQLFILRSTAHTHTHFHGVYVFGIKFAKFLFAQTYFIYLLGHTSSFLSLDFVWIMNQIATLKIWNVSKHLEMFTPLSHFGEYIRSWDWIATRNYVSYNENRQILCVKFGKTKTFT